jgi:hypothetical protein
LTGRYPALNVLIFILNLVFFNFLAFLAFFLLFLTLLDVLVFDHQSNQGELRVIGSYFYHHNFLGNLMLIYTAHHTPS